MPKDTSIPAKTWRIRRLFLRAGVLSFVREMLQTGAGSSVYAFPPALPSKAQTNSVVFLSLQARGKQWEVRQKFSGIFAAAGGVDEDLLVSVGRMRVKEIKSELSALNIRTDDVFEKDELVKRLISARQKSTPGKDVGDRGSDDAAVPNGQSSSSRITAPLIFYSMESGSVAAKNVENVFLRPAPGQFASLSVGIPSSKKSIGDKKLSLLVDTACSGVVLRPSVVREHGLPTYSSPVTMMAAGGQNGGNGLTQLSKMVISGSAFGPLPAAVQDIGALPSALDGIIGLSFLSQFACVDMDFRNGSLALDRTARQPPEPTGLTVIAAANLSPTKLGIWTADVMLDGRGPVKMLVDSGAASTFLNWKGVSDMALSRDSPLISQNQDAMGAMGADNVALVLSHRFVLQRMFNFSVPTGSSSPGLDIRDGGPLNIDIGDLPVLNALQHDGVGGILGADLLMRCDVLRMNLRGPAAKIDLFK